MNRHQRRSDLASFKREAHREQLLTYLIDADDDVSLNRMPLLRRATEFWHGNIPHRKPVCPSCKSGFADGAQPGAFLFSVIAVAPINASVTAFCRACWNDLPPEVIEREAARVLRCLLPGGKFLDPER
jgi:hypothetical protein